MSDSGHHQESCESCALSSMIGRDKKSKGRHKPCITALVLVIVAIMVFFVFLILRSCNKRIRSGANG